MIPPSPKDVENTKGTSKINVVVSYTLFSIVPYVVHNGKVEKLPEIDLVPVRKK